MLNWREIDAVIFDMDGTLVDSMYYWRHLSEGWFKRQGREVPGSLRDELDAADLWQAAELLANKYSRADVRPEDVYAELQAEIDGYYAHDIPLMPNAREILQQLAAAGKPACIATMTDRPQVQTVLGTHAIGEYISFVMTTPEVGAGKSRPDIFLQAADKFGLPPGRVLVAEDSVTAVKTALRAGFPVAVMKTPGYDYTEIGGIGGKIFYIDDFSELLPIARG